MQDTKTIDEATWVFGYGSLIYKVDFPYLKRQRASISGYQRRFWQGSHDHRGTPEQPGRVVTLIDAADALCRGIAYLVEPEVFSHLDHREKNGYERQHLEIALEGRDTVQGVTYIARPGNHAFVGSANLADIASQIHSARGPSGHNKDYVLLLAQALRELNETDHHVYALEALLLQS